MSAMSLDRLFQSDRLVYRAQSNNQEEKVFMRDLMMNDSASYAQSTIRLLAPPRPEDVDKDMSGSSSALLAVVICLRPEQDSGTEPKLVGWISLDCHALMRHHRTVNLGIIIAPEYQGKGYGTEAINWALDWAFAVAGMHAVRLTAFSFNDRAVRLYERLGFVREGIKRESLYYDCQWHDHILFSMLEGEWAVLRGRKIPS